MKKKKTKTKKNKKKTDVFTNSLQTNAPERMFLSLCFPIQKSYVAKKEENLSAKQLYVWLVVGWDSTQEPSNVLTSA